MQLFNFLPKANCQENGHHRRASTKALYAIFNRYASKEVDKEKFMTAVDFVVSFLRILDETNYNEETVKLLGSIVDSTKDGLISFSDFQAFEGLLCCPDALHKIMFHLFDTNGTGVITFDQFENIIRQTEVFHKHPIDFQSDYVRLYFGKDRDRRLTYYEFSEFIHNFSDDYACERFKIADKDGSGYISLIHFEEIMINIKKYILSELVATHLTEIGQGSKRRDKVSYSYFSAFNSLLNNIETIKSVYLYAAEGNRNYPVVQDQFLYAAQVISQMTPLEVEILYHICDVLFHRRQLLYKDFATMLPEQCHKQAHHRLTDIRAVSSPEDRGPLIQVLESVYRFTLGSISGAVGATAVYPIDLVKTRMQNQRTGSFIGELMYRNSWDCLRKVVRHEGFLGLYRGLVPQMIGVAPEKAIKLTVNDLVRDHMSDSNGNILLCAEVLAGACAGGCQVIFTNPLEIVKIRLQVAGEIASHRKPSAWNVVRELGVFGVYRGAGACLLRDVPFSAIYFPMYAHTKSLLSNDSGYNTLTSLFVSGLVSGVPAAYLVTPADVIKTRLQVVARTGQTTYSGVFDATKKIYMEEGFSAFWKGSIARVFRSAPQFGFTLLTYELLQRVLYVDFGGSHPSGSEERIPMIPQSRNEDHIGGYSLSVPLFMGIETKFGVFLPKYRNAKGAS